MSTPTFFIQIDGYDEEDHADAVAAVLSTLSKRQHGWPILEKLEALSPSENPHAVRIVSPVLTRTGERKGET